MAVLRRVFRGLRSLGAQRVRLACLRKRLRDHLAVRADGDCIKAGQRQLVTCVRRQAPVVAAAQCGLVSRVQSRHAAVFLIQFAMIEKLPDRDALRQLRYAADMV